MGYQPADTRWFADCTFGIAAHWTSQSMPSVGLPAPHAQAVAAFDVARFLDDIVGCGADYVLFTITHAHQYLPAPSQVIDGLLPGRTCRRDLLGELINGCVRRKLALLLYYNHSCNHGEDPAWEQAVGYHGPDKRILADNLCRIVAELGQRYGGDLRGWWFDSPYSLDPSGPANSVSTDMTGFRFPWERFVQAAKCGHAERLVTLNPGMQLSEWMFKYTDHQDYLAGEANDLREPPESRLAPNGLQNHRWVCIDNPAWVHSQANTPLLGPRYTVDQVTAYLRAARAARTPVTFNVDIDQGGHLSPRSLEVCAAAGASLR